MAGENIFNMAMAAAEPAGIYSNLMQGVQDRNTLDAQRMQNLIAQNQVNQLPLMNQFDATKLQQVQQQMEAQRLQDEQTQMQMRQARLVQGAREALALPPSRRTPFLVGVANEIDPSGAFARDFLDMQANNPAEVQATLERLSAMGNAAKTAGEREFEAMTKGLTQEEIEDARRVNLGIKARAGESAEERIARDQGLTANVARSQATIAGAEEGAKEEAQLGVQLRLLPKIRAEIAKVEAGAKASGETVTDLTRAEAAMPGLLEVSDKLKKLADVATYTTTGKLIDLASKELGFGSTKGATARSTMISIVDNQVLPLLRDTFGAAFTVAEGDRLRDSLLDPDASPESKKATLDAFIDQKYRNIKTKKTELGLESTTETPKTQTGQFKSSSGITFTVE